MNKNLIIAKLERLNVLLEEKVEETDNSIVFWEGRIEKSGENAIVEVNNITYKDCLNTAIENGKYYEKEIEENEALIRELRKEAQNEN